MITTLTNNKHSGLVDTVQRGLEGYTREGRSLEY
jgi:hypothetical protein